VRHKIQLRRNWIFHGQSNEGQGLIPDIPNFGIHLKSRPGLETLHYYFAAGGEGNESFDTGAISVRPVTGFA